MQIDSKFTFQLVLSEELVSNYFAQAANINGKEIL